MRNHQISNFDRVTPFAIFAFFGGGQPTSQILYFHDLLANKGSGLSAVTQPVLPDWLTAPEAAFHGGRTDRESGEYGDELGETWETVGE